MVDARVEAPWKRYLHPAEVGRHDVIKVYSTTEINLLTNLDKYITFGLLCYLFFLYIQRCTETYIHIHTYMKI